MSLKRRLKSLEGRLGIDEEPTVVYFATRFENEDGTDTPGYVWASVFGGGIDLLHLQSNEGESEDAFRERVDEIIRKQTVTSG